MIDYEIQSFIAELIQTGFNASAREFKQEIMSCLKRLIRFDMALWVSGHSQDLKVHNTYLFNLPNTIMDSWEQLKHQDRLLAGLILNPGKTFDVHDFYAVQERENLEIYQRHSRVFGIENAISTAIQNPVTGLLEVMSLYRRDPKAKFSQKERSVKQFIFPLLIETWHHNQIQYLAHRFGSGIGEWLAICDHNACIHHAESGFVDLLKSQWPEWSGPELPEPVKAWLKGLESEPLKRKNISFSRADFNDVILVKAYRSGSTVLLTKREEQIATIFADGLTYRGIAHELNISPFTVRSHLESVYKKLEVSSKVGLLQALKNNRTKMGL